MGGQFLGHQLKKIFEKIKGKNYKNIGFHVNINIRRVNKSIKNWVIEEDITMDSQSTKASSFINKKRFYYKNSIEDFLKGKPCVLDGKGGYEEEYALLRLRLSEGLINEKYFNRFKKNIPNDYFKRAKLYEPYGLLKIKENESIKLTQKGFLVSNKLISDIIN